MRGDPNVIKFSALKLIPRAAGSLGAAGFQDLRGGGEDVESVVAQSPGEKEAKPAPHNFHVGDKQSNCVTAESDCHGTRNRGRWRSKPV